MDRRRSASLGVLIAAALATLATSPMPVTPPPTANQSTRGSVELSAEHPVAARELDLRIEGVGQGGPRPTVILPPKLAGDAIGREDIRLSIVPLDGDFDTNDAFRRISEGPAVPVSHPLVCDGEGCGGRFGLLVEWLEPGDEPIDVDWDVTATVELWDAKPVAPADIQFTNADVASGAAPALTTAHAAPEPVRLDARNREALWRVSMRLGEDALATRARWPLVVTGRLRSTSEFLVAPPQDPDPKAGLFIEPQLEGMSGGATIGIQEQSIEFEPFWLCNAGEQCDASYVIGVSDDYADPGTSLDGSWELDVRAIGVDGTAVPVEVSVEPVPPMPMITAMASGSIDVAPNKASNFEYRLIEEATAGFDDRWDGLRLPTYGILTARATWTGSGPIPPGLSISFASWGLEIDGDPLVTSFAPGERSRCRVGDCVVAGSFGPTYGTMGDVPKDWSVRIDWQFEAGMGTSAIDGDSTLKIEEIVEPSPS